MAKIRIGIVGYGNVGRGVEKAVAAADDMELKAIFSQRDAAQLELADKSTPVIPLADAEKSKDEIDVMILCGGSANDLAEHGPRFAKIFNTVDSYDVHARIPEYLKAVDAAATDTTAIISAGWDPGLFSLVRVLSESVLPDGEGYSFWGVGVSQGHSNAIRAVEGVEDAVQYTVPIEKAVDAARSGSRPQLTAREKHLRECYVVAKPDADKASIEEKIKTMPDYFADYDTTVSFISGDEFNAKHKKMPHGGLVVRSGATGSNEHVIEYSLKLDSNPEFTGSVLAACARAVFRMSKEGNYGAKTLLDVPVSYLSKTDRMTLISDLM